MHAYPLANNPIMLWMMVLTVFGLVILGLTIASMMAISSWRGRRASELRRKRLIYGRCVHCGYDRRGANSILCPECGK